MRATSKKKFSVHILLIYERPFGSVLSKARWFIQHKVFYLELIENITQITYHDILLSIN
jgi:hypothetical protein